MTVALHCGDCLEILPSLAESSIDACISDPPYHLASIVKRFGAEGAKPAKSNGASGVYRRASAGFMGQKWDGGDIAFRPETWAQVLRVLKPGAHLAAFGAPKNFHRLAVAIEDAGFEIRDCVMWLFGQGFPKSHDLAKAIDKKLGAEGSYGAAKSEAHAGWINRGALRGDEGNEGYQRPWMQDQEAVDRNARLYEPATEEAMEWSGYGTALKPAYEPIILARKPLSEKSIAENVLRWGTGAINVDGCRIEAADGVPIFAGRREDAVNCYGNGKNGSNRTGEIASGRWPANIAHDGSSEVIDLFPHSGGGRFPANRGSGGIACDGHRGQSGLQERKTSAGSADRFFYCAKATKADRADSKHPTVKPVRLLRWLIRMICPPGGLILDPFAGTGTTAEAAHLEGRNAILVERERQYQVDIARRLTQVPGVDLIDAIQYPEAA